MSDRAIPNLPSRDFDATISFYGAFGFDVSFRSGDWLILRRGELQLEFFPFPEVVPASSSFMCTIRVDDVDGLYRAVAQAGVPEVAVGHPRLHPIGVQPWGGRAGFLIDPDGTQLHLVGNDA